MDLANRLKAILKGASQAEIIELDHITWGVRTDSSSIGAKKCTLGLLSVSIISHMLNVRITILIPAAKNGYRKILDVNDKVVGVHLFILLEPYKMLYYFLGRRPQRVRSVYTCTIPVLLNVKERHPQYPDKLRVFPLVGRDIIEFDSFWPIMDGSILGCALGYPGSLIRCKIGGYPSTLSFGPYTNSLFTDSSFRVFIPVWKSGGNFTGELIIMIRPLFNFCLAECPGVSFNHSSAGYDKAFYAFRGVVNDGVQSVFKCVRFGCNSTIRCLGNLLLDFQCRHDCDESLLRFLPEYCTSSMYQSFADYQRAWCPLLVDLSVPSTEAYSLTIGPVNPFKILYPLNLIPLLGVGYVTFHTCREMCYLFKSPFDFMYQQLNTLKEVFTSYRLVMVTGRFRYHVLSQFKLYCIYSSINFIQVKGYCDVPRNFKGLAIVLDIGSSNVFDEDRTRLIESLLCRCRLVVFRERSIISLLTLSSNHYTINCNTSSKTVLRNLQNLFSGHALYIYRRFLLPRLFPKVDNMPVAILAKEMSSCMHEVWLEVCQRIGVPSKCHLE